MTRPCRRAWRGGHKRTGWTEGVRGSWRSCSCCCRASGLNPDRIRVLGLVVCQLLSALTTIFAAKDIPTHHLTAVQGDPVYMPCNISTSEEGDAVVIVLWYREDLGTPIYTVDTRDRSLLQADRWSADNVFANRAYFMADKSPAELGVDHVKESDAGVYRCRVDFRKAQTRNTKINLTVIVPPHKLAIVDESGNEKTSVVGPYLEGADALLFCDVYGGKPKPIVTWWRDEEKLDQTVSADSGSMVRSEISLKNLGRKDLNARLTCRASNNNRTPPVTATVHVNINLPPLGVEILGALQPLSAGRRYDLVCQSSGSRPPAAVTWWKEGQRMDGAKETVSSDGNTTTSAISFVPSKEDGGRYLSCRSANSALTAAELETKWKLKIQYVPECKIKLGKSLNENTIREGSDVYFDCSVEAEPPVYKVDWRHNGRQLHHNVGQGIIITNQSLVLQGVSRSSAGDYSCKGFNSEGESESSPFHLDVLYAPTCRPNQMRVYGIAKAEKASITCSVEANPSEVSFRWLFNNSAESIDVASSHITKSGTVSVVSYTPRTEMDYGTLLCWAKNSIGDQRVPCVFHIIAAGRPDPVINCTVSNVSISSFSIKCTEGFNGGLPQSFFMEVLQTATQGIERNTTSPFPRFIVDDLEAGIQYHSLVYAYNPKGRSEPVVLQASTLQIPEKQLTSEKERRKSVLQMIPLMTMASILGGALILMSAAIALVLRIRCHRATKRKLQKRGREPTFVTYGRGSGDGDEKNPDVIPQPVAAECEDRISYLIQRHRISTIETTSPAKGLLGSSFQARGPRSYCTLRNGVHSHREDFSHFCHSIVEEMSIASGNCTVPRKHWKGASAYPTIDSITPSRNSSADEHLENSVVISKIESTV